MLYSWTAVGQTGSNRFDTFLFHENHMTKEFKPQNTPKTQKGKNRPSALSACFAWSAVNRPSVSISTRQVFPAEPWAVTVGNGG
jgi:hypothetical protein